MTSNDLETSEEAYLRVISDKTAELFAAASRVGAVLGERSEAEEEALDAYGRNLGIAFQLIDDMLDYSAREVGTGQIHRRRFPRRQDHPSGGAGLPRRQRERSANFWRRTLEQQDQQEGDLARAIELMNRHGCLYASWDRANQYGELARRALVAFRDCPERAPSWRPSISAWRVVIDRPQLRWLRLAVAALAIRRYIARRPECSSAW